jgi:hypothetical protein
MIDHSCAYYYITSVTRLRTWTLVCQDTYERTFVIAQHYVRSRCAAVMGHHLYECASVKIRYLRRYMRDIHCHVPVRSTVGGEEGLGSALRRLSRAHTSRQSQKKEPSRGGEALSTSPRWFKISWMLFKKRIPAHYLVLSICHSRHTIPAMRFPPWASNI